MTPEIVLRCGHTEKNIQKSKKIVKIFSHSVIELSVETRLYLLSSKEMGGDLLIDMLIT